jgi:hypothetical protein
MFAWFSVTTTRASSMKRVTYSRSRVSSGRSFLRTQYFSRPAMPPSFARYTSPMPPRAKFSSRRYWPNGRGKRSSPGADDAARWPEIGVVLASASLMPVPPRG